MKHRVRRFFHRISWVLLPVFLVIGFFYPAAGLAAVVCMSAPPLVSLFRGRVWCGHYCPRGSFLDLLFRKTQGVVPSFSSGKKRLIRIAVFAALMTLFGVQLAFAGTLRDAGFIFARMVFLTTAAAFVLGLLFGRRGWCSVCPMGTLSRYAAKLRTRTAGHPAISADCVSCRLCDAACPMKIPVHTYRGCTVTDPDCTQCLSCVQKCPRKAISV